MIKGRQATVTTKLITVWTANRFEPHAHIITGWMLCWERLGPPHFPFIYRIHKPHNYWVVEMEHIDGKRPIKWNQAQADTILTELANANILHRDIRPENLIERPTGEWCLIDFGWACDCNNPYPARREVGGIYYKGASEPRDTYAMGKIKHAMETGTVRIRGLTQ